MTRDYLSSIDTAMLQLEDPINLMMITGVMVFRSPIDFERLKATVEVRLLGVRRFRQRLPWAPTTGRMRVAVSILSYAGEVRLGLLTDIGLVPDPKTIIDAFHAGFEALLARARS